MHWVHFTTLLEHLQTKSNLHWCRLLEGEKIVRIESRPETKSTCPSVENELERLQELETTVV